MNPIIFTIGSVNFYSYGLFAALAIIFGYLCFEKLTRHKKIFDDKLINKYLFVILAAIVFARLSYFILYQDEFSSFWQIFYLWQGGLTSFGGIFGGLLAFIVLFKKNLPMWLDILGVSFLLGSFFWRIGCTLAGDHPTVATNFFININGRVAVTVYESILSLFGFMVFCYLFYRNKIVSGYIFWLVIGYYGIIRLIVDTWRIDPIKIIGLNLGQFIGLLMIIASILAIILKFMYGKDRK